MGVTITSANWSRQINVSDSDWVRERQQQHHDKEQLINSLRPTLAHLEIEFFSNVPECLLFLLLLLILLMKEWKKKTQRIRYVFEISKLFNVFNEYKYFYDNLVGQINQMCCLATACV